MKIYSIPLTIGEMKIKATVRFYLIPVRMAILCYRVLEVTSIGETMDKMKPSYFSGGNENCTATMENSTEFPQK